VAPAAVGSQTVRMAPTTWPLFGLRIVTPRLELRYADDADVLALAELAVLGIHDPGTMPFSFPWTDAPALELRRNAVQFYWRQRAEWTPTHWHLPFTTVVDGEVVGTQSAIADDFTVLREVGTGSWLGRAHQGRGIGKEMRAAVLHFAFAGLGAEYALTGAWHDNAASLGVTRSLGYVEDGQRRAKRRDVPDWLVGFRLARSQWEERRRDDINIEGLDACLDQFGVSE
jgi:RimJ/RimL family protein N-acetyltransferase